MSSDWALVLPVPGGSTEESLSTRIGGAAALVHCLHCAASSATAVVAVAEALAAHVTALLASAEIDAVVESVSGEATFTECLAAALTRVTAPYVLVHDARRPLASDDLAASVLDGLRQGSDVVIPVLGLVDSVKAVDAAGAVLETVDRTRLRAAQFPRGFARERLMVTLEKSSTGTGFDETMLTLATVVEGEPDAFVLEFPRDAALADAIIACRLAGQR